MSAGMRNQAELYVHFPTVTPYGETIVGLDYDNSEIETLTATHEIDPISRRLPSESCTFTIIDDYDEPKFNPDNPATGDFCTQFVKGVPFYVYYGMTKDDGTIMYATEYDTYYLTDKPTVNDNKVTFTGVTRMGVLQENEAEFQETRAQRAVQGAVNTLGELAGYVAADYGLTSSQVDFDDVSDEDVDPTQGVIPADTHQNCLLYLAHAGAAMLYTKRDKVTIARSPMIESSSLTPVAVIDKDSIFENTLKFSLSPKLRNMICKAKDYKQFGFVTIFDGKIEKVSSTELDYTITFEDGDVLHNPTGTGACYQILGDTNGIVDSIDEYQHQLVLHCVFPTGVTESDVKIRAWLQSDKGVIYTVQKNATGEDNIEDNTLVTTVNDITGIGAYDYLYQFAYRISTYLANENTYEFEYRGNPLLECGDIVTIQTDYADELTCVVLRNEISFSGAYRGKMLVKVVA